MSLYANMPEQFKLGQIENEVPLSEQQRQREEIEEILRRFSKQPGVVLADEVGMGKTFVALAVSYCVGVQNQVGPVVIMVPPNLVEKWELDLRAFCGAYLTGVQVVARHDADASRINRPGIVRYGVAHHSVEFLRILDDPKREQCHIVFLAQGAMSRSQTDIWVRLALIRETLKRHGRRAHLQKVKGQIHRFLAELLYARGQQQASKTGDKIWARLLREDSGRWMELFNRNLKNDRRALADSPVPDAVTEALCELSLNGIANALAEMPIRARGGDERLSERIDVARDALRDAERDLWKRIIAKMRFRSPLLILDEAHHLKNPGTALARQFQESNEDLKLGDGALAKSFDRMLFLTATPFQLGHEELVRILRRFGDVQWNGNSFGAKDQFTSGLDSLRDSLTASQRASIRVQKAWSRIAEEDLPDDSTIDDWWQQLIQQPLESLEHRQKILVEAFRQAEQLKDEAEQKLRPWIVRHNKGDFWQGTTIARRQRFVGAGILDGGSTNGGLPIPGDQLLPFYLAARSAANAGKDLLGEALSSSYEAFRRTRRHNSVTKDDRDVATQAVELTHSRWFLDEFDHSIRKVSGAVHPKIHATVQRAVDLWEGGEKVLVFAFYRRTCRALRIHISQEVEKRIRTHARSRLAGAGISHDDKAIRNLIRSIQQRFFSTKAPGRQTLDQALSAIVAEHKPDLLTANVPIQTVQDVMRRFLRVPTNLVRAFPIHEHGHTDPGVLVERMLDSHDVSGISWRHKFELFLHFLLSRGSDQERENYLDAVHRMQTGATRVKSADDGVDTDDEDSAVLTLANVQIATGQTERTHRARLMRAFNTPFFPDIFICSQVMGEGVDLHRYCRHVIHHDLDWNPSSIEQRTGRIDRLGCKAERQRLAITAYLPYISGTADERQFRVMTDRENWFRIVMGQEEVAKLIPEDGEQRHPRSPESLQQALIFNLKPPSCVD